MVVTPGAGYLAEQTELLAAGAARIRSLRRLSTAQANQAPIAGGWSVAQCLEHATLTAELYLPFMAAALQRARDRGPATGASRGRGTLAGRMLIGALDPRRPRPMKLRAPAMFRPAASGIDWAALHDRADAVHERLAAILAAGERLDLDRIRHRTPISFLIRVSLSQALRIQAIHIERHLQQADRVIARLAL